MPILEGVCWVTPDGWLLLCVAAMSVKPRRSPESGSCVVLCCALLGCISDREGTARPAVAGVRGAVGEDTAGSGFDAGRAAVDVSSRSTRDSSRLEAWLPDCVADCKVSQGGLRGHVDGASGTKDTPAASDSVVPFPS